MSATSLVSNQNQPSLLIDLDAVKARQQGAWSSGDCIRSQSSGDESHQQSATSGAQKRRLLRPSSRATVGRTLALSGANIG